MFNLFYLVNVESATASVQEDKERELRKIRSATARLSIVCCRAPSARCILCRESVGCAAMDTLVKGALTGSEAYQWSPEVFFAACVEVY